MGDEPGRHSDMYCVEVELPARAAASVMVTASAWMVSALFMNISFLKSDCFVQALRLSIPSLPDCLPHRGCAPSRRLISPLEQSRRGGAFRRLNRACVPGRATIGPFFSKRELRWDRAQGAFAAATGHWSSSAS